MIEINPPQKTGGNSIPLIVSLTLTILFIFGAFYALSAIGDAQRPLCGTLPSTVHSYTPIYSVENDLAVQGSFFLGIGRVNSYPVYIFFTGDDKNGFQRKMLDATNVFVFRDTETPYLIRKTIYKMTPMPPTEICTPNEIYELHIPENTLIKEVEL